MSLAIPVRGTLLLTCEYVAKRAANKKAGAASESYERKTAVDIALVQNRVAAADHKRERAQGKQPMQHSAKTSDTALCIIATTTNSTGHIPA
jgi:hypothetical protein